jgi:tartrate-resistant acid phosphatase type 5
VKNKFGLLAMTKKINIIIILMKYPFFFISTLLLSISCTFLEDDLTRPDFEIYEREDGVDYLEVIAIGDCGTGGTGQIKTALAMKNYAETIPVNFVLYLGDSCYPSGFSSIYDHNWQTCFENIYNYKVLDFPFYAMLGNHDYRGSIEAQLEYSATFETRFTLPAKYYSFTHTLQDSTEIHFIILDTTIIQKNNDDSETELIWFENELSSSTADWKVVLGHYPLYSNGEHGNNERLIGIIEPILINNNVDLYIAGHEHDLELIKNETGPYHIVSGTGAHIREFHSGTNTIYGVNFLGMSVLRFSSNELVIMFVLDDNSIDYSYKITK